MPSCTEIKCQDEASTKEHTAGAPIEYPTKGKRAVILLCLVLGTFLVGVDTTIISVAIPRISTDFRALDSVGWYGSAYLMTLTASKPTMGKVYKMFSPKTAYLACIALFEGMCLTSWQITSLEISPNVLWIRTLIPRSRYNHLCRRSYLRQFHSRPSSGRVGSRRLDPRRSRDYHLHCTFRETSAVHWGRRQCFRY